MHKLYINFFNFKRSTLRELNYLENGNCIIY